MHKKILFLMSGFLWCSLVCAAPEFGGKISQVKVGAKSSVIIDEKQYLFASDALLTVDGRRQLMVTALRQGLLVRYTLDYRTPKNNVIKTLKVTGPAGVVEEYLNE